MASNPLFLMEDQTDEDFFNKLIEDDSDTEPNQVSTSSTVAVKLVDELVSDDAKAFTNLSIGDDSQYGDRLHDVISEKDSLDVAAAHSSEIQLKDEEPRPVDVDARVSESLSQNKRSESGGSGVKVVGWGSFYVDATENGANGFGSDVFSEIGESVQDSHAEVEENVNASETTFSAYAESRTASLGDSVSYWQHQEGQDYSNAANHNANGQDLYSIQYWESMYPGWKYDLNTGQWYQPESYENSTNEVSDGKSDVAYLSQSTHSAVGASVEANTIENFPGWTQINGYPEHMFFHPYYPGWYYDSITQEFQILESYNAGDQLTVHGHEPQSQSGFSFGTPGGDNSNSSYSKHRQNYRDLSQDLGCQSQQQSWNFSSGHPGIDMQEQGNLAKTEVGLETGIPNFPNQQGTSVYNSEDSLNDQVSHRQLPATQSCDEANNGHFETNRLAGSQRFIPAASVTQQFKDITNEWNVQTSFSHNFYGDQKTVDIMQKSFQSNQQFSHDPSIGRSPDGRPPHALVTFGFGGKLIVMKNYSSFQNSAYGSQDAGRSSIAVLNLMEVVTANTNASGTGSDGYFHALGQQSLPGPLLGGSIGSRDVYKWIDEKISCCDSPDGDFSRGEHLKLLLSLLKISCQYYGKLRSPFGSDTMLKEKDTAEVTVANLFASAKRFNANGGHGSSKECLQGLPSEAQMKKTASEVQNLLVSGKKLEALQRAQEGQLWGPALVIATQLGDQFYVDTVKQMAIRQLVAGTPLRTLCLLIAGRPGELFSTGMTNDHCLPGSGYMSQQHAQLGTNSMLDEWEENLAVITANRTKDDELVITHLGDCLWKERSKIIAAHICYVIAEKNLEPYSDTARLCLLGVDHWKFPRTYASPEAIQMTELYEYSKVLGNSQYILLPLQPYKLVYAHMLAEVGRVSEALKYCQAILKSPKIGRAPEVETWKQMVSSLEERIRIHQQGGYTNLAPAKLVGKLLNFFDSTAHRVVGGLPPAAPSTSLGNIQVNDFHDQLTAPRVSASQSNMTMSSLMPSASMEPISDWATVGNKVTMNNRSVSEPDLGRRPEQDHISSSKEERARNAQNKTSDVAAGSRLSRLGFGTGLLKKTVGLVLRPRQGRQAKLGERNKFYYDEKLKRWVEEGAEPPAEEAALPPPPMTAAFSIADYGKQADVKAQSSPAGGSPNINGPTPSNSPGIPPTPGGSNQFSARGRMGIRSRYVDTFNKGRATSTAMFHSSSVPSVKAPVAANAKFFVPAPVASDEAAGEARTESVQDEDSAIEAASVPTVSEPFETHSPSPVTMHRFPSMDNITRPRSTANTTVSHLAPSRRTASWSGSFNNAFSSPEKAEIKPSGSNLGMSPSHFMPSSRSGSSLGDDLQEVEL